MSNSISSFNGNNLKTDQLHNGIRSGILSVIADDHDNNIFSHGGCCCWY